jgi:hypothetical protein
MVFMQGFSINLIIFRYFNYCVLCKSDYFLLLKVLKMFNCWKQFIVFVCSYHRVSPCPWKIITLKCCAYVGSVTVFKVRLFAFKLA